MQTLFTRVNAFLKTLQVRQFLSMLLVGAIFMTTSVAKADLTPGVKAELDRVTTQGEVDGRPRTTRQWEAENEALQGNPVKQLERIAEQSADAIGEMAEIYPQNAKTLTPGMENGRLPQDD